MKITSSTLRKGNKENSTCITALDIFSIVRQGSPLSPDLFIVYPIDMFYWSKNQSFKIFADDNFIRTTLFWCFRFCSAADYCKQFFFFLCGHKAPPSAKMPWGYLSIKVLLYKAKRIIYNIYKSMIVYVLSINLLNGLSIF